MNAKKLPLRITKAKAVELYPEISEKTIRSWIRDIQKQYRKSRYNPRAHNLEPVEWLALLKEARIPIGYCRIFEDDELMEDKLANYPNLK